ncbi:MAG: hypothetical protein ABSA02_05930 [Trebonia sp.]
MATSSGSVIEAVGVGFFVAPPKAHPSRVYVVVYRDGSMQSFSGVPSIADRVSSKLCYLVDVSEQYTSSTCTVTSAVDAYSFSVELSATWRVSDPQAAVRANLSDGGALVLGSLEDTVWQIARGFQPERAAAAESAVRGTLSGQLQLAGGVTVLRAVARFRADSAVTNATVDRDAATHQGILERERMDRLRDMFDGSEASALMLHMLQHPEDTGTVLATLKDNREKEQALRVALQAGDRQHYLAILDRALDNNLINDTDAQPLRDLLFGQPAVGGTGSVAMVPIAHRPTLGLPPGITAGGAASGPGAGAPGIAQPTGGQAPPAAPPAGQGYPAAAPPVTPGYVVEDVLAGPGDDPDPNQAAPASAPAPGSEPGGVRAWKPLKKPGQGN